MDRIAYSSEKYVFTDLFRDSIDYSVLSQKNIIEMSEVEIKSYELYNRSQRIVPHGPLDQNLGVGRKDLLCATCQRTI